MRKRHWKYVGCVICKGLILSRLRSWILLNVSNIFHHTPQSVMITARIKVCCSCNHNIKFNWIRFLLSKSSPCSHISWWNCFLSFFLFFILQQMLNLFSFCVSRTGMQRPPWEKKELKLLLERKRKMHQFKAKMQRRKGKNRFLFQVFPQHWLTLVILKKYDSREVKLSNLPLTK